MSGCLSQCYRLVYRLRTVSGVLIRGEGNESTASEDYIPGSEIRRGLHLTEGEKEMQFSFAYLCLNGKRGVPSPASFSYLKSDHTQVRDQLSDGRREDDFDRERLLWVCYMDDPSADTMISASVRKKTINIDGQNIFAIAPDQIFSGFVIGSEQQICALKKLCKTQPEIKTGAGQEWGLGRCEIEAVYMEKIQKAPVNEQEEFIVHINSPLPIFMENGLYDERPEAILSEIERVLNCPGGLSITGICRKTGTFYRKNQPAALCTDKGSGLRICSNIGPVDISPLFNAWLGNFSNDGYGEITAQAVPQNHYRKMLVLGEDI